MPHPLLFILAACLLARASGFGFDVVVDDPSYLACIIKGMGDTKPPPLADAVWDAYLNGMSDRLGCGAMDNTGTIGIIGDQLLDAARNGRTYWEMALARLSSDGDERACIMLGLAREGFAVSCQLTRAELASVFNYACGSMLIVSLGARSLDTSFCC